MVSNKMENLNEKSVIFIRDNKIYLVTQPLGTFDWSWGINSLKAIHS